MEEVGKLESRLQSAAAFVEGGIQDSCDDSCSICLEAFCDNDPSTVTSCKHEFHLHCILEWCQRSSQCPMCWQNISLMDSTSQELLEAVERERSFRANQNTNTTIFHHPTFGEFEVQHLPAGATDADLEERIIQHLAAAAAIRRAHHGSRRGLRSGTASQGRPQVLFFSTRPNGTSAAAVSASQEPSVLSISESQLLPQASLTVPGEIDRAVGLQPGNSSASASSPIRSTQHSTRAIRSVGESSPNSHDRAGPSDLHTFSESLKSRLNAVSTRYKESISKSTRGLKERFFSRGASMAEIGSEVRREVSAGIASVSRMMERIDMRESSSPARGNAQHSVMGSSSERVADGRADILSNDTPPPNTCAASSGSQ
ncbi:hypothetical protein HPP92_018632 [Vanilla planifolia]|uniref:RING-type E3 ubiquitin transferase n=1 Tax=Vanilla planifolia TaxID=51239 RepID=A0A835QFZ0_VANPL|nr:hypothetical protein HPP92_018632 [Vanilla planifolia]